MTRSGDLFGWLGCTLEDRVVIEEVIGEGGYGVVYRGRHLGFDSSVAVKCLKVPAELDQAERTAFVEDFRTEARLLHKLSRKTKGIVQALDVGSAVSPLGIWVPYILMEWVEGVTLESELAQRDETGQPQRPLAEAAALLAPIAEALAVAHAENVAHLDIKPANILLARDGSAKLLDFGIAKLLSQSDTLTRATGRGGTPAPFTPAYGAPEQFNPRHGKRGPPTDVFALALVLIEACSGRPALIGDSPIQLYVASANEDFRPSLSAEGVRVSEAVEQVVRRALEVDPQRRFPDAGAMWAALEAAMRGPATTVTGASPVRVSIIPAPEPSARVSVISQRARSSPLAATAPAPASAGSAQHRICTVLFAELSGSDDAERLDPEDLGDAVERGVAAIGAEVRACGGTVEGVVGETVVAVFGLYASSASAAERGVHAALRIKAARGGAAPAKRRGGPPPHGGRIGVSTRRVYVGAQSATGGFRLTASGGPMKLAPRLQRLASPMDILVDRDTHRQVAGLFDVELLAADRGPPSAGELKVYRVLGGASGRHGLNATLLRDFGGLTTRFVGRSAETASLAAIAETVAKEPCARFVTLLGPPGIGRSRLLVELADRLEADEWMVLAAHCSALRTRMSYGLAAELLRSRFHVLEGDAPEVVGAKLRAGLRRLRGLANVEALPLTASGLHATDDHEDDEIVSQLARLFGVDSGESGPPLSVDEQESPAKQRIAGAVAALLGLVSRPIAILCDDLHWADEASASLLEDLCVRLPGTPLLIACTATPELVERRPLWGEGEAAHARVNVGPLDRRHLEEMTRDRLRKAESLPDEAVKRLVEHSEGSPLTLVETLHLLVDAGAIDTTDRDRWRIKEERLRELALPTSVHGIVQARLDRLEAPARLVLSHAAVVGRTFWEGVVLDLEATRPESADLSRLLVELRDRGLIRARASSAFPDDREYVFAEATTQRVAYETLARKDRRELHGVVAAWLAARNPSDAGASLLATHYEKAGALGEAIDAYHRAGAHAAALGQNAEATACYERACRLDDWMMGEGDPADETSEGLVDWEPPEDAPAPSWVARAALRVEAADVLRRMGRFDAAEERYLHARTRIVGPEREGAAPGGADVPTWEARIDYRLAVVDKLRGEVDVALPRLEGAIAAAERGGLGEERAEMLALQASLLRRQGRLDACREACLRGLRVCRTIGRHGERWRLAVSKLLNTLGTMFFGRGSLVRAERCYLQAARVIDERKSPEQASVVLNNVAAVCYARKDLHRAKQCFQRVFRLTETSGDLWVRLTALGNLGEVELALGGHKGAKECLVEAVRLGEQIRAHLDLPECYRNLARVLLALGEGGPALDAASRALELVKSTGSRVYFPAVATTVAEVCAANAAAPAPDPRGGGLAVELSAALEASDLAPEVIARCRSLLERAGAAAAPALAGGAGGESPTR